MNKKVLFLFLGVIVLNIIFDSKFQLHYDEAYYWVWSQNLSLSYYDHPPMIAYMIRLTSLLGHSEVFVRLSTIITTSITILTIYALAKKMFGGQTANIVILLAIACPLIEGMFFIVTIDSPLLMFWALTLYAFYSGVFENKVKFIYLAGFFAGCALLSKYTAILIFPGLFLFLLTAKEYRYFLYKKDLYLAFILAILVFSPVIIWNYEHDWISFGYQFHHGVNSNNGISQQTFSEYLGGGILILGPFLFFALLYYTFKYLRINFTEPKLAFLFWSYAFGFVFFAYISLHKHTEVNWAAPAYISALIFLAFWLVKNDNRWIYRTSVALIIIVLMVAKFPLFFIPAKYHTQLQGLNVFYGNKELLEHAKPYLTPDTVLLACDYGNASRAWYYLQAKKVYVLHKFPYANAYRYWDYDIPQPIMKAVYVCDNNDNEANKMLHQYFKNVRLLEYATFNNKITGSKEYIYQATN